MDNDKPKLSREEINGRVDRLYDTRGGNIGDNTQREDKPMFDRRKATIEAHLIIEEWFDKIGDEMKYYPPKEIDILVAILEHHMQEVFRRGYNSAINPSSPDNQKSE